MEDTEDKIAKITVTRVRYRRDPQTGRTPTHTEYSLVCGETVLTVTAGEYFTSAKKFRDWCLETDKVRDAGINEITIDPPASASLGFNA